MEVDQRAENQVLVGMRSDYECTWLWLNLKSALSATDISTQRPPSSVRFALFQELLVHLGSGSGVLALSETSDIESRQRRVRRYCDLPDIELHLIHAQTYLSHVSTCCERNHFRPCNYEC
jgi:hypothetical protein